MHACTSPRVHLAGAQYQRRLLSAARTPRRIHAAPTTRSSSEDTSTATSLLLASLHAERVAALSSARLATRRADRLAPKVGALEAEALAAVRAGDEGAARAALEKKAAVNATVEACRRRAGVQMQLAAVLGLKMEKVRRIGG